jgi:hypothetical protein
MLFGDSAEEDPAMRKKLARKWRTVLGLNVLVSTINGNGHPTFIWKPSSRPKQEPRKSLQHSLLKYIVSILVRNNEIVAAVAHKPNVSTTAQSGAYQVNIMSSTRQNAAPLQQVSLPTAFTAVANPHNVKPPRRVEPRSGKPPEQDPYFANAPPDIDCLVVTGESHILDSNSEDATLWARILKIR